MSKTLDELLTATQDTNIISSDRFTWERFGLLGALTDYQLSYFKGDICEIGIGESSIMFSKLALKHNVRTWNCDYSRGLFEETLMTPGYFNEDSAVFCGTSTEFFEYIKPTKARFSVSFIDGDHMIETVAEDFWNCYKNTIKNGLIFLHDTNPPDESWTVPEKCGTAYQILDVLKTHKDKVDVFTFVRSAFDVGLTMVRKI